MNFNKNSGKDIVMEDIVVGRSPIVMEDIVLGRRDIVMEDIIGPGGPKPLI